MKLRGNKLVPTIFGLNKRAEMIWSQTSVLDLYVLLPWSRTVSETYEHKFADHVFIFIWQRRWKRGWSPVRGPSSPHHAHWAQHGGCHCGAHGGRQLGAELTGAVHDRRCGRWAWIPSAWLFFFSSPQIPEHRRFYPQTYANSILLTEITHVK